MVAIPVEWYARYFHNSWWQVDFQKYRHHGLKLSTNDPSLPQRLLQSTSTIDMLSGDQTDLGAMFGLFAFEWLVPPGVIRRRRS